MCEVWGPNRCGDGKWKKMGDQDERRLTVSWPVGMVGQPQTPTWPGPSRLPPDRVPSALRSANLAESQQTNLLETSGEGARSRNAWCASDFTS